MHIDIKDFNKLKELVQYSRNFIGGVRVNKKKTKHKVECADWAALYLNMGEALDILDNEVINKTIEGKNDLDNDEHEWDNVIPFEYNRYKCKHCKIIREGCYEHDEEVVFVYYFLKDFKQIHIKPNKTYIDINKCSKIPYKVLDNEKESDAKEAYFKSYFKRIQSRLYNVLRYVHNSSDWKIWDYGESFHTQLGINVIRYFSIIHNTSISIPYTVERCIDYSDSSVEVLRDMVKTLASTDNVFACLLNRHKDNGIGDCCHPIPNEDTCPICNKLTKEFYRKLNNTSVSSN